MNGIRLRTRRTLRVVRKLSRTLAEALFWDERKFRKEMSRSPIRYRLDKARAALVLGRLRAQPLVRGIVVLVIASTMIQLSTLPLMAVYFNRVSPVGILLNVTAGLLTAALMLLAVGAIASAWIAAKLGWIIVASHDALVNALCLSQTSRSPHSA